MTSTSPFTVFDLAEALKRYEKNGGDMSAPIFVEQSGDADFSKIQGVKGYLVTDTDTRKHCMCIDIGHEDYHHPAVPWP